MKFPLLATLLLVSITLGGRADALMTSSSYRIYGDSIGTSGARSTSASYLLSDSVGDFGAGTASSTNYQLLSGFQELSEHPTFSFSISSASINLGTLSTGSVSSSSNTVTTSTNAPFGYTTAVVEDGALRTGGSDINDVSDGAVTAGSEEYGIALAGGDRSFTDDRALSTTALTIASRTNWKNGAATTVTYKASIASDTAAGSYSHTVTYVSTGNF